MKEIVCIKFLNFSLILKIKDPQVNQNLILGKIKKILSSYRMWKLFIESIAYFFLTILLISSIKVAAYLPVITKYNFQKLGLPLNDSLSWIFENTESSDKVSAYVLLHNLGLNYPPFIVSIIGILFTSILLVSFFPKEKKILRNIKKYILFIFTLFGVLVTLFSIWGA